MLPYKHYMRYAEMNNVPQLVANIRQKLDSIRENLPRHCEGEGSYCRIHRLVEDELGNYLNTKIYILLIEKIFKIN